MPIKFINFYVNITVEMHKGELIRDYYFNKLSENEF